MSDRKTAAELRERAATVNVGVWAELYRHLAAVEEEREATTASDEELRAEVTRLRDLHIEIRKALNAGPDESTVGAAKRVVQERDSLVGKWKEVDDLTRSRDDWKARHDQVFAEADVKIDELHMKLAKARADLDDAALHETRMNATLEKTAHDAHTAIARAEAAEKRVAELESLEARAGRIQDDATRAGIREGLERAAVECERERDEWSIACERERNSASGCALRIRAMKAEVK